MADDLAVDQVQLKDNMRMELLILSWELRELRFNIDFDCCHKSIGCWYWRSNSSYHTHANKKLSACGICWKKSKREASGTWSPAQVQDFKFMQPNQCTMLPVLAILSLLVGKGTQGRWQLLGKYVIAALTQILKQMCLSRKYPHVGANYPGTCNH